MIDDVPTRPHRFAASPALAPLLLLLPLLAAAACGPPPEARRAQRLLAAGRVAEAEQLADRELARFPKQPLLWRVKIQAAFARRDPARAVALYREWVALRGAPDRDALRAMAMSTLWQALRTPSPAIRLRAVQIAERLELEPLADEVMRRMGDDDPAVRAAAAVAVLRAHPDAPRIATDALSSDRAEARAIAVEGIARKVGRRALPDLVPRLRDPDARVRRAAVRAVAPLAPARVLADILRMARRDPAGPVRAEALRAAADRGAPGIVPAAVAALRDPYLGARLAAVAALARRAGAEATARLRPLVSGGDPLVALRAAAALARRDRDPGAVVAAATAALAQPAWPIRAAALNALPADGGNPAVAAARRAASRDPEVRVRLAAARALVRLGARDDARATLAAVLAGDDDDARIEAAIDLARLGDSRGGPALAALAEAASPLTRRRAVRALRYLGEPSDALAGALADEDAEVRVTAAETALELLAD